MVVIEPEPSDISEQKEKEKSMEDVTVISKEKEHEEKGKSDSVVTVDAEDDQEEESFEDAMDDEQHKQKALNQANDAKTVGNDLFRSGQYSDALSQYEVAIQIAPEGALSEDLISKCHYNRATCFAKLGKFNDTIKECTKALELDSSYAKALIRRSEAHEKLEHYDEAIADMKKTVELDSSNLQAGKTIRRLEPLAEAKREKMKEEMMGKLKEMGNSILGRFGMSVDNFKAVKDPNTGSYSVSFQR